MLTKQTVPHIGLWDKLELVSEENPNGASYKSRVEDVTSDGIVISQPEFAGGDGQLLTAHSHVYVRFLRSDAMYQFSARMKSIKDVTGKKVLLYDIGRLERVQRREFVRIIFDLTLDYALLSKDDWNIDTLEWKPSSTIDISAGGLLMRVDDSVQKDDRLLLDFDRAYNKQLPQMITAICCRVVDKNNNRLAGVKFIRRKDLTKYFSPEQIDRLPEPARKFDALAQNELSKFIFNEQVHKRQMGTL